MGAGKKKSGGSVGQCTTPQGVAVLSPDQRKYAMGRISEISTAKLIEVRKRCTTEGSGPTDWVKLRAIRDYNVELLRDVTLDTPLREAFDFSDLSPEDVVDEENLHDAQESIRAQVAVVKDAVMFADATEALRLLKEFAESPLPELLPLKKKEGKKGGRK